MAMGSAGSVMGALALVRLCVWPESAMLPEPCVWPESTWVCGLTAAVLPTPAARKVIPASVSFPMLAAPDDVVPLMLAVPVSVWPPIVGAAAAVIALA